MTKHINLTAELTVNNLDFSGKVDEPFIATSRTRVFLRPVDDEAADELQSWHLGKIVESTDVLDQVAEIIGDMSDFKIKARDKDGFLPFLIIQGHTGRTLAFDITVNHSEVEDEVEDDDTDDEVVTADVENEVEAAAETVES